MERLPDLILQQAQTQQDVIDEGHDWFIYIIEPGGPFVEPARTNHDWEDREPDCVVKVVITKLPIDPPEQIYAEIVRQIKLHYRRCQA